MIRIVLIDDHLIVREGLRAMLLVRPDITVVGEASNGAEALPLLTRLVPDVALLDLEMPGMDGVALLRHLATLKIPTPVLILTAFGSDEHILRAIEAGARGYLLKDASLREVVQAIEIVAAGGVWLAPQVAGRVVTTMGQMLQAGAVPVTLTAQERAILTLAAQGLGNRAIGDQMGFAERTVKLHLTLIYHKLSVTNRTEAVALALRDHLITLHEGDAPSRT